MAAAIDDQSPDHVKAESSLHSPSSAGTNPSSAATATSSNAVANAASHASRKRASRAGTRSVSTLSAAQLERKRANDREAQRAIRQRTKEHIERLERKLQEVSHSGEPSRDLDDAREKIRYLEDENRLLKQRLGEHGHYALGGINDPSREYSFARPHPVPSTGPDPRLLQILGTTCRI